MKSIARLDGESVRTVAKELHGESSSIQGLVIKAAVSARTTQDDSWAANLVGDGTDVIAGSVDFLCRARSSAASVKPREPVRVGVPEKVV